MLRTAPSGVNAFFGGMEELLNHGFLGFGRYNQIEAKAIESIAPTIDFCRAGVPPAILYSRGRLATGRVRPTADTAASTVILALRSLQRRR